MIDRILALRVQTRCRREFYQGLFTAYVDLRKAFNSVNRDALWRILGLRGVPPKLINLMSKLYSGYRECCEMWWYHLRHISSCFWSSSGVCTDPHIFQRLYGLDSGEDVGGSSYGASFGNVKISDLDFTVDAVSFAETLDILLGALEMLNKESEFLGLQVSSVKMKIQAFNDILDATILSVPVCGEDVEITKRFTYLGSFFCCRYFGAQNNNEHHHNQHLNNHAIHTTTPTITPFTLRRHLQQLHHHHFRHSTRTARPRSPRDG